MSRLKEMKKSQEKGASSPVYTILTVIVVLFFGVIIYFGFLAPRPTLNLDTLEGNGHFEGSKDAKVRIVEFSDFQCPSCGRVYPFFKQLLQDFPTSVKITYRQFPLPQHINAQKAAEASECAADQGKFWEMHDRMFENQENLKVTDLKSYAKSLGLDQTVFDKCLDSGKYASKVAADKSYGVSIGVDSTPTIYINGEKVSPSSYGDLKSAVEAKLK